MHSISLEGSDVAKSSWERSRVQKKKKEEQKEEEEEEEEEEGKSLFQSAGAAWRKQRGGPTSERA